MHRLYGSMIDSSQIKIIQEAVQQYSPKFVGIFGSYARNEQHADSDLDILIDFEKSVHLLDLIGLEQELSELLHVKVDLVTLRSVHEQIKSYIFNDLIRIL
jgi:predicted nucleotidyltransferase